VSLAKRVTELHRNTDKELTDVTVSRVEDKKKSPSKLGVKVAAAVAGLAAAVVLQTTANHPFWDETADKWVDASELTVGHELRTADGDKVVVDKVVNYEGAKEMRDLTVADIHTYYVAAGDERVLVHNCTPGASCTCRPALPAATREPPNAGAISSRDAEPGEEFNMVLSHGQPVDRPGGFGTFDDVPDQDYARNQLAIRSDWKSDVSLVQRYRIPDGDPIRIQESVVGAQLDPGTGRVLVGGGSQLEIMNYSDRARLIPVGDSTEIR
ncbi:polymorphic toxin-type HINT domain-containing protein, partial [Micromonospora sp. NPDC050397]|uniref:polymorphic toxin-type HINT domain-containing protein n=1 Tax=Micromonospora sp. NPDC050397 TaxID=3364279 RepID=UPI003850A8FF